MNASLTTLKIRSGGQTGADIAALDWAIKAGVPHCGWCPKGRLSEAGPIPSQYHLKETASANYAERTRLNVRDSDGTAVFTIVPKLKGGSLATCKFALELGRP